jgi:RecA-family ATPase
VSEEIVAGLVRAQQLWVLGGSYGLGKSPFLQDLVVRITSGVPWCGRPVVKRPVVYVDLENPAAVIKGNMERVCGRLGIPTPDNLAVYLDTTALKSRARLP